MQFQVRLAEVKDPSPRMDSVLRGWPRCDGGLRENLGCLRLSSFDPHL